MAAIGDTNLVCWFLVSGGLSDSYFGLFFYYFFIIRYKLSTTKSKYLLYCLLMFSQYQ